MSKSCRLFYNDKELWHCGSCEAERPPCQASCLLETWQFEHSELQTLCHCKPALQAQLEETGFERKTLCRTCTQHCDTYSSVTSSPSEQGSGEERSMSTLQRTLQCKPIAHKTWMRTWGELFKILYMQLEARSAESGSTKNLATDKPECCDMKHLCETNYVNSFVHDVPCYRAVVDYGVWRVQSVNLEQ